ncbi:MULTISPECIES: MFS transporter [Rhodococcus]|uniref:Metabolite transporter n=1 Tax=Rhodococcus pyridinivorans KG-16 TaxID=1441730 RepID=A0A0V9UPP9_9NOCA|nr:MULTISPECIES: MFS transporter [Rhodococcus]KSZ59968.1 metabolite transporter [Rhodococcus pyridinivorans KG-16]BDB62698.1 MFS transporter [Rhodococcus sp. RDE2]
MTYSVIDEAPYGKFHRKLVLLSSGGPFLDGYILGNIGVVIVGIQTQLGLTSTELGLVGAAALVGLFLGGLGFGRLTDVIGRKLMYTIDLGAMLVGSLLCLFVQEGWQLIVLRLFLGIAIGADYPIATAMLSEWLPRKERGRCMGMLMAWWFIGASAAYIVGFGLIQLLGDDAWRWVLASAAVPALAIMVARHGTPESPRWLISNGHREQAQENIASALGRPVTEQELDVLAAQEASTGMGFGHAFKKPYGKRTLFVSLFWTCQIIPLFALYTFGPTILAAFNMSDDSILGSLLISLVFLIGLIPAIKLIDRIGRRPLIIWSFALMIIPLTILGLAPGAAIPVVVICFCLYAFFSGGPSILEWAYPTELFPTEIRGTAVGFATSVSRIGAAVGTYLLPVGLTHLGLGTTMLLGAGVTLIGLLVCIAWAPETKDRSLQEAAGIHREQPQSLDLSRH